jgi:hypothetical protein
MVGGWSNSPRDCEHAITLEGRPQHCGGGEWDRHRKVGLGEVTSLLAAFFTDTGNGELFRGRGHSGAKKRGGLSVPDPPAVISLPHQLSSAFTLNRISWRETQSF